MSEQAGGIVGRAVPRGRLAATVRASIGGARSAVLVSGTAGMGKTSLIRAALDDAAGGAVVAWGTCWPGDGAPGFWPWMQAFDHLSRAVGPEVAVAAAGRDRAALSVLVRDLVADGDRNSDPDRHRLLLLDAAGRWLEALAARRPVVVVLDDLHWADPSTLELLDFVTAAPAPARLAVIGAYRHDELDATGRDRLGALEGRTGHVHLDGLSVDEVEALVGGICGPDAARALAPGLHDRTGGHPLFVRELARLPDEDQRTPLPTAVTGAVTRRLDRLPAETRLVLDAAAVLGNRLLPDVLGVVTGSTADAVRDLLAPAVAAGVVGRMGGDDLRFAHDLFRETILDHVGAGTRRELHARIGHALAARRARGAEVAPGDVAGHLARALGSVDPEDAIAWAREAAADERRRSAFEEAAAHLRRVRRAADDAGVALEPGTRVGLLVDEADHRARAGDPDAARALLGDAARLAPNPGWDADVALAVQRLGARFAMPRDEIVGQLERALSGLDPADVTRRARLTAALARVLQHSVAQDRGRAGPLSERALALGRRSGDDETLVACLLARHDARWQPGTGRERATLAREIAAVGARLGSTDREAEGLLLEANSLLEAGSAAFRPVLDRWFALLEARDEPHDRYLVQTRRAALALLAGDAERAGALVHEAARTGERIHEPDTGNVLMSQRVALAHIADDPAELAALAGDAVAWWTGAPVLAHAVAAGAWARAGDLEAAAREVDVVVAAGGLAGEGSYLRSVLVGHLADAAVALGDLGRCRTLLDDIDGLTGSCGVNGAVVAFAGPFAHPAGILAAALGQTDRARTLLDGSVATAHRLGAAVWVRRGEAARRALDEQPTPPAGGQAGSVRLASMVRAGRLWTVTWGDEHGALAHVKGLADLAVLVQHRGREIPALRLAGGSDATGAGPDPLVDRQALDAYRRRLDDLDAELDRAGAQADRGRLEALGDEREQLLAEVGRATGLGGRLRSHPGDPAERARKAVSARIRDAITRLDAVAPLMAAHLDRSVRTGLRCCYDPAADEPVSWRIELP